MRFAILVVICAGLPACSTDISRFDYPVLGMNDGAGKDQPDVRDQTNYDRYGDNRGRNYEQLQKSRDYASDKRDDIYDTSSTDNPRDTYNRRSQYDQDRSEYDRRQLQREKLPELRQERRYDEQRRGDEYSQNQKSQNKYKPVSKEDKFQSAKPLRDSNDRHIVSEGDTLYNISRRYGVQTDKIRAANGFEGDDIKLGQHLYIPGLSKGQSKLELSSKKTGGATYKVVEGDTLYSISRQHGIKPKELADANGITDIGNVKLGQTLQIPGDGVSQTPVQVASIERKVSIKKSRLENSRKAAIKKIPKSVNEKKIKLDKKIVRTNTSGKNRFMWPVDGKILSQFGRQKSGTMNDGVNLAVPAGTSVKAAESGVVAYAGNELKGYGNLILVRHKDSWVTAYAHNSKLLVKRGDKVRRGQVIAKSGKSGSVYQPQLHFELRRGSKPVNPMKHLAMR